MQLKLLSLRNARWSFRKLSLFPFIKVIHNCYQNVVTYRSHKVQSAEYMEVYLSTMKHSVTEGLGQQIVTGISETYTIIPPKKIMRYEY